MLVLSCLTIGVSGTNLGGGPLSSMLLREIFARKHFISRSLRSTTIFIRHISLTPSVLDILLGLILVDLLKDEPLELDAVLGPLDIVLRLKLRVDVSALDYVLKSSRPLKFPSGPIRYSAMKVILSLHPIHELVSACLVWRWRAGHPGTPR